MTTADLKHISGSLSSSPRKDGKTALNALATSHFQTMYGDKKISESTKAESRRLASKNGLQSSSIDDRPSSHPCLKPSNEKLLSEYQNIGQTLLIAEAASYRVGIPWLPPTQAVRARVSRFHGPLAEFIRLSLVTVSTQTLECYASDLGASELQDAEALCIPMPTLAQRYSLTVLLGGTFFAATCLLHNAFERMVLQSIVASSVVALVAIALGIVVSSEGYRRRSFMVLLSNELDRRRGMDASGTTAVVNPIESKPIPD